jgi:hypothetical protein
MNGREDDAEFEAFLKRRSPLPRRLSGIDDAEPAAELDRLVLNRARQAIDTPRVPLFRGSRWTLPVGLAAALLITFAVVLNIDSRGAKTARPIASLAEQYDIPAAPDAASASANSARLTASSRAGAVQTLVTSPSAPPEAAPAPHSSPDAWLREIERLRAAGKTAEADREQVAFRKAYPTYPVDSVGRSSATPPTR